MERAKAGASGRPVLLATLGMPFDQAAATFAVDSAVESGSPLIVANVTQLEPLRMSLVLGYDALEELTPEVSESVRAPAELARSLGVVVERLRVRSPRPVRALLDLVRERGAGLVVFGPDRRRIKPRAYERAVRAIREGVDCLVWIAADAPGP
ncbi:MAG TPA: universal stress protein [Actinomycetota bacterium]